MRIALGTVAVLLASSASLVAADPPPGVSVAIADPIGAPDAYSGPVDRATYYLWSEGDVWHLRTRTQEKTRSFTGLIRVRGGKVVALETEPVAPKVGKKGKPKTRQTNDAIRVAEAGRAIRFSFLTSGGEDGFSFKVNAPAAAVEFT